MSTSQGWPRRATGRLRPLEPLRALLAVEAEVLTLSGSGMSIRLAFAPDLGSHHAFALVVADSTLEVRGLVRSVVPDPQGHGHRVGVEFEGLAPGEHRLLESFVERKLQRA